MFAMPAGCDEYVAVKSWILVEKRDSTVVLVDDVMSEVRVSLDQLADEAATNESLSERLEVNDGAAQGPNLSGQCPKGSSMHLAAEGGLCPPPPTNTCR